MREAEIIELIRRRDERGAEELLRHFGALIRYVVSPILPDERDREDCLSEVLMRVWEGIGGFDPARGSWKSWLTALARNAALNRRRDAGPQPAPLGEQGAQLPGPEEAVLAGEELEELRRAVAALPAGDRLLVYRKYYYLQSTAQIAAELGLSPRAVEGRLYRLKKTPRQGAGRCAQWMNAGSTPSSVRPSPTRRPQRWRSPSDPGAGPCTSSAGAWR